MRAKNLPKQQNPRALCFRDFSKRARKNLSGLQVQDFQLLEQMMTWMSSNEEIN